MWNLKTIFTIIPKFKLYDHCPLKYVTLKPLDEIWSGAHCLKVECLHFKVNVNICIFTIVISSKFTFEPRTDHIANKYGFQHIRSLSRSLATENFVDASLLACAQPEYESISGCAQATSLLATKENLNLFGNDVKDLETVPMSLNNGSAMTTTLKTKGDYKTRFLGGCSEKRECKKAMYR